MSEQSKSNFQALGAGLLGFVAVMAVGGAVMMLSSRQSQTASRPLPAAAPIDLGSSMPRPMTSPASAQRERRAESPAPLIGDQGEAAPASSAQPASGAAPAQSFPVAPAEQSSAKPEGGAKALEVTKHLDASGNSTTAVASAKNATAAQKAADKKAAKKAAALAKIDAPPAGSDAVASVHYGVTDRSELMGRAAGPVYNFQGSSKGGSTAGAGKMAAGDVNDKLADIKKQLENANLPPEQRAALLKQIDDAGKGVDASAK